MIDKALPGTATIQEANRISAAILAYIGDAVWELMARLLPGTVSSNVDTAHRKTVALVSARAQAEAVKKLLPLLTEEENAVFKRGRNISTHNAPGSATEAEYHASTGLEALIGWLYITGQTERAEQLFKEGINAA